MDTYNSAPMVRKGGFLQLPNGNWIDPTYVRMVEATAPVEANSLLRMPAIPARVIIHIGNSGDQRDIYAKSFEDARSLRDTLVRRLTNAEETK